MKILQTGSRKFDKDNWEVYHPNGKHMFTTNGRRAGWYLDRKLAVQLGEEKKIKLTYTPKGEGFAENEVFGKHPRLHACVVCGCETDLQRHHVVPYHYRKFMPLEYKSRNHHDVVLICHKHHAEYERIAKDYKQQLAEKYEIATIEQYNSNKVSSIVYRLKNQFKASKLLHVLLVKYNDLPLDKIEWLCKELKHVAHIDALNMTFDELEVFAEELENAVEFEISRIHKEEDLVHGKAVVQRLLSDKDYEDFIRGWRKHFIDTMKPQFMPVGWSINFRFKFTR